MLIKEVCTQCGLTKKAVEYYEEQGLIHPATSENRYRNFSAYDAECLKTIAVLRRLGLNIKYIKSVLCSTGNDVLCGIAHQCNLESKREMVKQRLLKKLSADIEINPLKSSIY